MDTQFTQGEYVHKHAWKHEGVDVVLSAKVKSRALEYAKEQKIKPKYRMAARGIKALIFSKAVWEEAYKILEDGS